MDRRSVARSGLVRAVIDTSSLVPPSFRRDLQQAAQLEFYVGIWSPWIIAELNRVLTWLWIRDKGTSRASQRECGKQAQVMMEILLSTFDLVDVRAPYPPAWDNLVDQWDIPVWAAAKNAQADYVISENTLHYPPVNEYGQNSYGGVEYVPAAEFLRRLYDDTE